MDRRTAPFLLSFVLAVGALAQPVIRTGSAPPPVLNAASYIGPELGLGAGIAQGSIFALFGSGFGASDSFAQATTFPLSKTLGGVSVQVTAGGVAVDAIMLNVYYGQVIEALLPSATPVGSGTITVSYGGVTSAPATVQVVPSSFGIYAANLRGIGQATATDASYTPNSIIHTFHPGDAVILWGTGLGPVTWDETNPPTAAELSGGLDIPTEVYVGNTTAVVDYHGRSGCCSGLDQIVFTVPDGVEGCYVPVAVKAGAVLSNIATIAISSSGNTCSDSIIGQDLIAKLAAGQTVAFGWIELDTVAGADYGSATFDQITPASAELASYGVSPGYCIATEGSEGNGPYLGDLSSPGLDAGATITLSGFTGKSSFPELSDTGLYFSEIYTNNYYLGWAGETYTLSNGTGGANVGPFSASIDIPPLGSAINNISENAILPRSSDLTVKWNTGAFEPDNPGVLGGVSMVFDSNLNLEAYTELQCNVSILAGQFTIPAWVLSFLEPSGPTVDGNSSGYIWLFQYGTPVTFSATGLDKGIITADMVTWVPVSFQ